MLILPAHIYAGEVNWERFKSRFISDDGRVIDTGNGHISHSEGQGLGMLFAVAHNDRKTFEKIWHWTDKNLGIRDDGLFVWRWLPDQEKHYHDLGSASDGDVLITWALARAAKKWGDPSYLDIAKKLAQIIRKQLLAEVYGDTLLLPGPVWPRREGHTVINLSYWIFPAFQELSEIDASQLWEKLNHTGIDLIKRARFGKWDLPADWFALKNDGSISQLDDFPFTFGYEAVRIPLYYLWGGYNQKDILRVFQAFWSSTAQGNKLVTIQGLAMDSTIQQENVLAYRAVSELVECAITGEDAPILDESFADYHDYYSASLFMVSQLIAKERMPNCILGKQNTDSTYLCLDNENPNCPIADPIHAKIEKGNIIVNIEDFVQIPPTKTRRPLARIGYLTHANDSTNRLFAVDEDGKIYVIKEGKLASEPFLDLSDIRGSDFYSDGPEAGVKTIVFHPDFANFGKPGYQHIYTVHTENKVSKPDNADVPVFPGSSKNVIHYDVISEWKVDAGNPDKVIAESRRELLRIAQSGEYNNLEHIGFNETLSKDDPDYGLLYISIGDGGSGEKSYVQPQKLDSILGKMLRIDPKPGSIKNSYEIPVTNPFLDKENTLPEIWAYGLHNPRHFSWDMKDKKMYLTDVGWQNIEEVNIGIPGANYGYRYREGSFVIKEENSSVFPLPANDDVWGFTYPVVQYDHDEGNEISGGFVYRGKRIPELYGYYIFGDAINGRIFYINIKDFPIDKQDMSLDVSNKIKELRLFYRGAEKNFLEILNFDSRADLSFGTDEYGELYILTKRDGMIRKVLPMNNEDIN